MEGRAEESIQAARHVSEHVDAEKMREPGFGTLQHFLALEMYALTRFGRWDELENYAKPASDLKYPTGVWHFSQGLARLRRGDLDGARKHLSALEELAADHDLDKVTIWETNSTRHILQVGEQVLAGEIASARGEHDNAIEHMREAVRLEDAMKYEEPQLWFAPTREFLGAILMQAKRPVDAEAVFRADLAKYPHNGWSLFGLNQALAAQGKTAEAERALQAFRKAWKRADVNLTAARL